MRKLPENKRFAMPIGLVEYALSQIHTLDERMRACVIRGIRCDYAVIAVDLDGTLSADDGSGRDRRDRIAKLNSMPADVYKIIYTARDESERENTEMWLKASRVKYHGLIMNKLPFELLIDDRAEPDTFLDEYRIDDDKENL